MHDVKGRHETWAHMEVHPSSSELMIEASTRIAMMAQKSLATVAVNRRADWYNIFSVSNMTPDGLKRFVACCKLPSMLFKLPTLTQEID